MAEMYLNKRELIKILSMIESIHPDGEIESVKIVSEGSSGIGTIVTATIAVQLNGYNGEFTTVISDEKDW